MKPLDLTRTAAALDAYDAFDVDFGKLMSAATTKEEVFALVHREHELGEAVGEAFGLDTMDRNSVSNCKQCVRPGPKHPLLGFGESWVRKVVREWRKTKGSEMSDP
jgi:hypothetical protein